jgi:Asp-tRNA(Asn)/Glu-tRNA(Gln) amidotransferase A subunit family amidase
MIENLLARKLTGKPLALAARATRTQRVAALGAQVLRRQLGISEIAGLLEDDDELELDLSPRAGRPARTLEQGLEVPTAAAWVMSADALTSRYREGSLTPPELITRVLREADALSRRQSFLRCLWMRDDARALREAEAAAQRYARGSALGPLDGVPFVVKEHIGIQGFPCRAGHDLPADEPLREDSTLVARLRAAGAIMIGQTAMTELGLSPVGINPKRPPLRNPHHVERTAGGSSTGSAVTASLGLVPFAVGTDGGGSVRIPAALCGLFGLKPTFGRISRAGSKLPGSVTHIGPIASSVIDLAHFLDVAAGPDTRDPTTQHAANSPGSFAECARRRVRGLVLGVDPHELRDAESSIARAVEQSIRAIENCGVRIAEIRIPLAAHALAIGSVTIMAESGSAEAKSFATHGPAYGFDMQVLIALTRELSTREYLDAQMLRTRMRRELARLFRDIDAIAFPTTYSTALPASQSEEHYGSVDAAAVRAMCRHTFLANLTGHPAGSAPVGVDAEGLPIGLQLIGDAWDEGTVIALMAELERLSIARPVRPPYHVGLLG